MVEQAEEMTLRAAAMLAYVRQQAEQGSPASIIRAADEYGQRHHQMMHIGRAKGEIVRDIVQQVAPKTCLELGTFFGYSAVLIAAAMPEEGHLFTVEFNTENAKIAQQFIHFAGVEDQVTVICGSSDDVIPHLRRDFSVATFDFVFLDHWKDVYRRDLGLLEGAGLLRPGTVLLADNVIRPGAPAYLKYVETSEKYRTQRFYSKLQYSDLEDALAKSIYVWGR